MTATVEYELSDETHSITRDVVHTEKDSYVVAHDETDGHGVSRKVLIPEHRVVMIHEGEGGEV